MSHSFPAQVGNIHAVRAAHKALEALALDARGSRGGGGEDAEAPAPEPGSSSLSGRVWAAVAKAPDKERDREKRPGDDASHSVFDDEGFDASRELGWLGLVEESGWLAAVRRLLPAWKSTAGSGRPDQTSELSISVTSKSIRLTFGRIDCSRRVIKAEPKSLRRNVQIRAH